MKTTVSTWCRTCLAALFVAFMVLPLVACESKAGKNTTTEQASATPPPASNGKPIILTDETFRELVHDYKTNTSTFEYKGSLPAIIDFYADWCGPCRRLSPKLAQIAEEYKGRIVVYKVDVDKYQEVATIFGVQSIPMVLFVPVEGVPYKAMGDLPIEYIKEMIQKIEHPEEEQEKPADSLQTSN